MSTSRKKTKSPDPVDVALMEAFAALPDEKKVHVSLRLDSDIYMELKRLADQGLANGKYQRLINRILRKALFPTEKASVSTGKTGARISAPIHAKSGRGK